MKLENEILKKSQRMYIFKEYSIIINEIETGTKLFDSELKRTKK